MQLCLRLDRIAEPPRRLPEPQPESNITPSLRDISMRLKPLMPPSSRPEETPKPPVASSLKHSQRLHSLSELRGKFTEVILTKNYAFILLIHMLVII